MAYAVVEIAVVAALLVGTMVVAPEHYWVIGGLWLGAYGLVSWISLWAYNAGVNRGLVRMSRVAPGTRRVFIVARNCPRRWLVKRHIRIYC